MLARLRNLLGRKSSSTSVGKRFTLLRSILIVGATAFGAYSSAMILSSLLDYQENDYDDFTILISLGLAGTFIFAILLYSTYMILLGFRTIWRKLYTSKML